MLFVAKASQEIVVVPIDKYTLADVASLPEFVAELLHKLNSYINYNKFEMLAFDNNTAYAIIWIQKLMIVMRNLWQKKSV